MAEFLAGMTAGILFAYAYHAHHTIMAIFFALCALIALIFGATLS